MDVFEIETTLAVTEYLIWKDIRIVETKIKFINVPQSLPLPPFLPTHSPSSSPFFTLLSPTPLLPLK